MSLSVLDFPQILNEGYTIESVATADYNCVAWAAGDDKNWWYPGYHWPTGVPRKFTINSLTQLFRRRGYRPCNNDDLEPGFEKVAIYALQRRAKHVARQKPNGFWTSKCGKNVDIEHPLAALAGPEYGEVVKILKRRMP